jgi:hypothetical protein
MKSILLKRFLSNMPLSLLDVLCFLSKKLGTPRYGQRTRGRNLAELNHSGPYMSKCTFERGLKIEDFLRGYFDWIGFLKIFGFENVKFKLSYLSYMQVIKVRNQCQIVVFT